MDIKTPVYREWIRLHAPSSAAAELVDFLAGFVEKHARARDAVRLERILITVVRYEAAFWDANY